MRILSDSDGNKYILHVEFETSNKPKMNFRMGEYRCMLHQIYDYPVKQYVIYIGKPRLSTPDRVNLPGLSFKYTLINFSSLNYKPFLSSDEPEEQILSVLGDFGGDDPTEVIKELLMKLVKNLAILQTRNTTSNCAYC